ncbi:ABC transporter transmembrane domain-containing protein [Anaerotalea alkaliphila]|uniref:ABC transporter transmembrane domain-containing protein n=1 Tax=Anaerotalea alkaliphila TaxID=2662126 RepID=UPI001BAA7904|nr:ABC transporter transmembrane domain-containing protein [Anaerotalea alkaliphila]
MALFAKDFTRHYKPFLFAMACLVSESFFDLMQPVLMASIVDIGVARNDFGTILRTGGLMLGITAAGAAMALGRSIISTTLSQEVGADLRREGTGPSAAGEQPL